MPVRYSGYGFNKTCIYEELSLLHGANELAEIRIHGRGGQGNVVAAYLLAAAVVQGGNYAQAFPSFGAERRGAPVTAFVRCRTSPILRRSQVERPDLLIVQDATLLSVPETLNGLRSDGGIVINAGPADTMIADLPPGHRLARIPASKIADETIGQTIPNVPLLGALIALTGIVPLDALFDALAERFIPEIAKRNQRAAERAASAVEFGVWQDLVPFGIGHADSN